MAKNQCLLAHSKARIVHVEAPWTIKFGAELIKSISLVKVDTIVRKPSAPDSEHSNKNELKWNPIAPTVHLEGT